jgi:hypothetical protein
MLSIATCWISLIYLSHTEASSGSAVAPKDLVVHRSLHIRGSWRLPTFQPAFAVEDSRTWEDSVTSSPLGHAFRKLTARDTRAAFTSWTSLTASESNRMQLVLFGSH